MSAHGAALAVEHAMRKPSYGGDVDAILALVERQRPTVVSSVLYDAAKLMIQQGYTLQRARTSMTLAWLAAGGEDDICHE